MPPSPATAQQTTPPLDAFMRRLLRVRPGTSSKRSAENAFSASLAISTVRCLLTYVLLPLLKPVIDLRGGVGPVLGLVIGTVSMIAIVASMRRFWGANHRFRWHYTVLGGTILVFLFVGAVLDIASLL